MSSFSDHPPLDQPEHRLGILSMLPHEALVALVRVAARDQDMDWLNPMVRGGLLDIDDIRKESGKSARKRATSAAPVKQEPSEAISHG